jgi:hypothetical protein
VKQLFWVIVLFSVAGCASPDSDPLGRWVEKQGELNLDKKADPAEKWLDDY